MMPSKRTSKRSHLQETSPTDQRSTKQPRLPCDQLERKREYDRVAQRAAREKNRNYISYLENLVQSLQKDGEPGDARVDLARKLKESQNEVLKLKKALGSISRIVKAADGDGDGIEREDTGSIDVPSNGMSVLTENDMKSGDECLNGHPPAMDETIPSGTCLLFDDTQSLNTPSLFHEDQTLIKTDLPLPTGNMNTISTESITRMASSITRNTDTEGRFWLLAGIILRHVLGSSSQWTLSYLADDDIAIRAVIEGWPSVIEHYPLDRGWQWLKELDERVYFHMDPVGRIVHLRNCRFQFLHQLYPTAGWDRSLPDFFAARPSQLHVKHDPVIDYFPWPSFRERLLFSTSRYATNRFMEALRQNVKFLTSRPPDDVYEKNAVTGLYTYSVRFLREIMDIRCYVAAPAFFQVFPELSQDIPVDTSYSIRVLDTQLLLPSTEPVREENEDDWVGIQRV